jgi:hypothetical protein
MTDETQPKSGAVRDSGPRLAIHEGYVKKGGQNTSYQIDTRPGSPAPMKPTSPGNGSPGPAATQASNPTATQEK